MERTNTAEWLEKYKRWQINVQKDGERRSFYSSIPGRNGQREANSKADEWLDDGLVDPNTKINVLYDRWIEELKTNTSYDHWNKYYGFGVNRIKPYIGNTKARKLTEQQLQDIITAAHKDGLAKKSLMNIRGCLSAFVKYMRKCKATKLVVENLYIPKGAPVGERTILQPKDLIVLFNVDATTWRGKVTKDPFINGYRLEVVTGMRPGEIIGLMAGDDSGSKIVIRRSINVHGETTKGKNDNAQRSFIKTALVVKILDDQRKLLEDMGIISKYLFPDKFGEPLKEQNYYKHWLRYRKHNKISEATPYELRHTFVSVAKKLPAGLVKSLVGHSEDMDTFGVYSHEMDGDMQIAADLVQETFSKLLK